MNTQATTVTPPAPPTCKLREGLEARSCPFCGSLNLCLGQGGFSNREVAALHCDGCGADGPFVFIEQQFSRPPKSHENRVIWDMAVTLAEEEAVGRWNAASSRARDSTVAEAALRGTFIEGYQEGLRKGTLDADPKAYVPVTQGRLDSERIWHERWGQHFATTK